MDMRNVYRLLIGKPEGKKPLRRPRCICVGNSKIDLGETVWGGMTGLIRLRIDQWKALVNTVINLRVP
jgi:hypothetical protein